MNGGALWWLRGWLCRWLGHVPIDTAPEWADTLGERICRYCYCEQSRGGVPDD